MKFGNKRRPRTYFSALEVLRQCAIQTHIPLHHFSMRNLAAIGHGVLVQEVLKIPKSVIFAGLCMVMHNSICRSR